MKLYRLILISFLAVGITIASCSKGDDSHQCNLSTAGASTQNASTILYSASKSGDGTLSSLTYESSSGSVTVNSPSLPFSVRVNVNAGATVGISASGKITHGGLIISMSYNNGGTFVSQADSCEAN